MNELIVGQKYRAKRVRSGSSTRGYWQLVAVTDKVDRNEIAIFVRNNPIDLKDGQEFVLQELHSLKWGMKKNNNERWVPKCSVEATLQPIVSEFDDMGVDGDDTMADPWKGIDITADIDGELPF